MPYDLNDPNLDFAGQAEILARALKRGQMLRGTTVETPSMHGGAVGGIGAALSRAAGVMDQNRAEQGQTALNNEQLRRYDELTRQMNAPQEGIDYSNPDALVADNARRMGVASKMSVLPMAQKVGQDYLAKGANFPEALAKMRMDQIERGQQSAQRAVDKDIADKRHEEMMKTIAANRNQTQITIAGMPSRNSGGGGGGEFSGTAPVIGADETGNPIYRHTKSGALFQFDANGQPVAYKGAVGAKPMPDKPLTEAQGNALLYGTRAAQAHNVLDEVGTDYSPMNLNIARGAENIPGGRALVNTKLLSPAEQKVDQAQRNFINAILRKESGAAINQGEFDNARLQYFPEQGDKPEVLAQKKANRELAIKGFGTMGGPKAEAAVKAEQANKPTATGGYSDAEKEKRYQEWKARQGK
jgi:hypothetical protein